MRTAQGAIAPFGTHNPAAHQSPPSIWRPIWHVGHLVFQGGIPRLKQQSMTGGGFFPVKDFAGREQPSWSPYATPISSQIGGGFFASRPNFLQPLAGGASTTQF